MSKFEEGPHRSLHQQRANKNQIGKINERIKALLENKKQGYTDELSVYLRVRNKQAKIKRTKELRRNHVTTMSDSSDPRESKGLSLETLKISSKYSYSKQKTRLSYLHHLKQFEQQFTQGKMDQKYQQMLGQYIESFSQTIDNDRDQFIKRATKDIKQKLFAYYISQTNHQKLEKLSVSQKQMVPSVQIHQHVNETRFKDTINQSIRLKSQNHSSKHNDLKRRQVPYILQSPSRYNQMQVQSIQQSFINQMENIHHSKVMAEKKRKSKEQSFLIKLKQLNNSFTPLVFKK